MTILGNGNVGIGTTTPGQLLEVAGTVKATGFLSTSDRRLKTDIRPIEGLDIITRLNGVRYNWINDGTPDFGLIAQEVEAVIPAAVITDKNTGYKGVKYPNLVAPLIESVKELKNRCDITDDRTLILESLVKDLRNEVSSLKEKNEKLEQRLKRIEQALGIK